jgi:S1-C subfamily serine protease
MVAWWIGGLVLFAVGLTIRLVLVANRPEPPAPPDLSLTETSSVVRAAPPEDTAQMVERVLRGVVAVHGRADGAGFVLDDRGHVLTTRQLVDGAPAVTVTTRTVRRSRQRSSARQARLRCCGSSRCSRRSPSAARPTSGSGTP